MGAFRGRRGPVRWLIVARSGVGSVAWLRRSVTVSVALRRDDSVTVHSLGRSPFHCRHPRSAGTRNPCGTPPGRSPFHHGADFQPGNTFRSTHTGAQRLHGETIPTAHTQPGRENSTGAHTTTDQGAERQPDTRTHQAPQACCRPQDSEGPPQATHNPINAHTARPTHPRPGGGLTAAGRCRKDFRPGADTFRGRPHTVRQDSSRRSRCRKARQNQLVGCGGRRARAQNRRSGINAGFPPGFCLGKARLSPVPGSQGHPGRIYA